MFHVFVVSYVSLGRSPYCRAFLEECTGVSLCTFWCLAVSTYFITYGTVSPVTTENITNILVS